MFWWTFHTFERALKQRPALPNQKGRSWMWSQRKKIISCIVHLWQFPIRKIKLLNVYNLSCVLTFTSFKQITHPKQWSVAFDNFVWNFWNSLVKSSGERQEVPVSQHKRMMAQRNSAARRSAIYSFTAKTKLNCSRSQFMRRERPTHARQTHTHVLNAMRALQVAGVATAGEWVLEGGGGQHPWWRLRSPITEDQ